MPDNGEQLGTPMGVPNCCLQPGGARAVVAKTDGMEIVCFGDAK